MIAKFHERQNEEQIPHCQRKSFRMISAFNADTIPHMTPTPPRTIQDRIRLRLAALGLNPSNTAEKANLDRGTIRKLLANPDQVPAGATLMKLAAALEVSEQWLLHGDGKITETLARQPMEGDAVHAQIRAPIFSGMPHDLPVRGTAAGALARGAFILEDVTDYKQRPPALARAKNAYAIYVCGDSMSPEHKHGALRFVHPDQPAVIGDSVLVITQTSKGTPAEATIGILISNQADFVEIGKHNPKSTDRIDRTLVTAIHKVLTLNDLFGG